jgi:hypothetical protein
VISTGAVEPASLKAFPLIVPYGSVADRGFEHTLKDCTHYRLGLTGCPRQKQQCVRRRKCAIGADFVRSQTTPALKGGLVI